MEIKKINRNKLELLINIEDLRKNNISIDTFMASSIQNEPFIWHIINLADNYFNYNNCKFETFFVSKIKTFVIIVTKKMSYNKKYKKLKLNTFYVARTSNINNLCNFCKSLNIHMSSSLYYLGKNYFLNISLLHLHDFKKLLLNCNEFCINFESKPYKNSNANIIIKNNAIESLAKFD